MSVNKEISSQLEVDLELIRRLDKNGPRYTSYPTADRFVEAVNAETYAQWVKKREIGGISRPLSLYVHIPFCNTLCFYYACNKVVVDSMTTRMVLRPETIDVLVATNLHADILSDLASSLSGSLGMGATANLNPERKYPSMFEPSMALRSTSWGRGSPTPSGPSGQRS